jgi:hypothetical protein
MRETMDPKVISSYGRPRDICEADAKLIGAEGAFLLNGVGNDTDRANTLPDAIRLAAERINKAAGETIIELER